MKINAITIEVHHFGPLDNVSFKLAPMMIFTGMSSLGKSYANYLVYYLMSSICNGKLLTVIKDDVNNSEEKRQYVFDLDVFFQDLSNHAEEFMRKFLGDDELKCDVEFKSLKIKRSLAIEFKKIKTETLNENEEKGPSIIHALQPYEISFDGGQKLDLPSFGYLRYFVENRLQEFILGESFARAVILPPGRGAFVGENFSMKSELASSMDMYNLYFRDYDNGINSRFHIRKGGDRNLPNRLLSMTSGGDIISVEGKQYLQINDNQKIALSAGASSIKDLSPWLFYLKNQWMVSCSFCMEEPEAHQHPSVTVQIADVMAVSMHQAASNFFHLTTHSDYLIQRINQLVKLGSIHRKDENLFRRICEERDLDPLSYLDAKDIQAYYFRKGKNGKTIVEKLAVTDDGIPMKTFFDVVRDLEEREDYINDALYRMEKEKI